MVDIGKPEVSLTLLLNIYIHMYEFMLHKGNNFDFVGDSCSLWEKASYIQDLKPANDRMVVSQRNELRQKIAGRLRTFTFWVGHVAFVEHHFGVFGQP